LKPHAAVLFLRDALTGRYEIRDFCARDINLLGQIIGAPDLSKLEKAIENKPYLLATGDRIQLYFRQYSAPDAVDTFCSVPIRNRNYLLGFINVYHSQADGEINDSHAQLVSALVAQISEAMGDQVELFENLRNTFKQTISSFAQALDRKDSYTAGHSGRTQVCASLLCDGLKLPEKEREMILDASLLHDIGKLNVDLSALNNPGKLSKSEVERFRMHPIHGKEILEPIFFLNELVPMVLYHHENYDGSGYPHGMRGEDIPLGARIISIADAYDAMTSNRAYRRAMAHEKAIKELKTNAGTQFDRQLVEIFVEQVSRHLEDGSITHLLMNIKG
jgi:HD-GYP domain-containing protein (c-di-GMP phosphodiesterase class II)